MKHPISIAARRSGLSPHTIRVWERRHGVLATGRCAKGRRYYSEADIEHLRLLRELTEKGHRIGNISKHTTEKLREVLTKEQSDCTAAPCECVEEVLQACHNAIRAHDAEALRGLLEGARRDVGHRAALRMLVGPLVQSVGELWRLGTMREAEEHLHAMVVRDFLTAPIPGHQTAPGAPELVAATPAGTVHEIGILLAAATARDLGWRVTYLGPSLPATEIARVANSRKVRAIALSVVHPVGCKEVRAEIESLRANVAPEATVIVGGRAAESYRECLANLEGVKWCGCLDEFENLLMAMG